MKKKVCNYCGKKAVWEKKREPNFEDILVCERCYNPYTMADFKKVEK